MIILILNKTGALTSELLLHYIRDAFCFPDYLLSVLTVIGSVIIQFSVEGEVTDTWTVALTTIQSSRSPAQSFCVDRDFEKNILIIFQMEGVSGYRLTTNLQPVTFNL